MPRVPMYDGPQVRDAPLQPVFQNTPDTSSGLTAIARGLGQVSEAADRIAQRQAVDDAFKLETALKGDWLETDTQLRKKYRGDNTAGYLDEVKKFWRDAPTKYGANSNALVKNLVGKSLSVYQNQAIGSASNYINGEQEKALDGNYAANQTLSTQAAVRDVSPTNAEAVAAATLPTLNKSVAAYGAMKGWSTEQVQAEQLRWASNYYVEATANLMNTSPSAAGNYLKAHRGDIDGKAYAALTERLKTVNDAQAAFGAADKVIESAGGFADGKPVELDKMEAAARGLFPNEPEKAKAAISEIRSRAQAFNAAENERAAANVSSVMGAFSDGASLAAIRRMPQFAALPGAKRAEIENSITNIQKARAGLDITQMQRAQQRLKLQGFAAYEQYSNPATLDTMSEAQITQLLPTLGNELTNSLLEKKRSIVKTDAKLVASMDQQDFDHIAQTMGMRPFEPNKSEDDKARLGELKYRVEQMINTAQTAKKGTLTRDEKAELMRLEMARTVKVSGWFSDDTKPVIQLTADEIKNVVVPAPERAQIVDAMKQMFDRTQSPQYAPTEANMRRFYLLSKSRAAALLPSENDNR